MRRRDTNGFSTATLFLLNAYRESRVAAWASLTVSDPGASEAPEPGAYFDARAHRYDGEYDRPSGYALRSRMAAVLDLVGDSPGEVVDAGMGAGRLLGELARRGWTVSGVDASAEMVTGARERLPDRAGAIVQGKIEDLPFPDAAFDVAIATGVLEYADVDAALRELRRVLRPAGVAVVSYPNPGNFYWTWRTHVWYRGAAFAKRLLRHPPLVFPPPSPTLTPAAFRARLAAAGLDPEHVRHTSFLVLPSPFDKLLPRTAERLGRLGERAAPTALRRLSGQVVYTARKPPDGC